MNQCVEDLHAGGHLIVVDDEIDPHLEAAEIQRRVYLSRGPAMLFSNVKGCRFPMVSNLFGTIERAEYLFRHTLEAVRRAIELKIDPQPLLPQPAPLLAGAAHRLADAAQAGPSRRRCWRGRSNFQRLAATGFLARRRRPVRHAAAGLHGTSRCSRDSRNSNLGHVSRATGGQRVSSRISEVGLHYQIHRGIGVHHQAALRTARSCGSTFSSVVRRR